MTRLNASIPLDRTELAAGNYAAAAELYTRGAELVDTTKLTTHSREEDEVYYRCMGNAALAYMKARKWTDVIDACDRLERKEGEEDDEKSAMIRRALSEAKGGDGAAEEPPPRAKLDDAARLKLLYRRGVARMNIGELGSAKTDLLAAHKLDEENKDVRRAIRELKAKRDEAKEKSKRAFGGFLERKDGAGMYDDKEMPAPTKSELGDGSDDDFVYEDKEERKRRERAEIPFDSTQDYLNSLLKQAQEEKS